MTPNDVRRENRVAWRSIWREIGLTRTSRRKLVLGLSKRGLVNAALGKSSHWLIDAALLEAMRRVAGSLQTDIEHYVPTTQPSELGETQKDRVVRRVREACGYGPS